MKKERGSGNGVRAHYDFSDGVRGKYAKRMAEGANVVLLDPDVARIFPDRRLVNETLRAVAQILDLTTRGGRRRPKPSIADRSVARATRAKSRTRPT